MKPRTDKGEIIVNLNIPQMAAIAVNFHYGKKNIYMEYGRGTGKSTILAWFIAQAVRQMPRSTGVLVGPTYVKMLSVTFNATKEGLEMFGLYENIDYVVGKSGVPLGFELPFQSPSNWRNAIHFRNGAILALVSLDMPDAGRGLNSYYVIGDEAALLNPERLFLNVQTTNRAKKSDFAKSKLLNAEIFASSTPLTKQGKWFVDMEKTAQKNPENYSFLKANAFANAANLNKDWFKQQELKAPSRLHYEAEILNIRPPGVLNGFYAKLNPKIHYYENRYDLNYLQEKGFNNYFADDNNCRQDADVVLSARLQLNLDFGKKINSGTVSQFLRSLNEVRYLKEFFVKQPKDMDDLLAEFVSYYLPFPEKIVELYHDTAGYKEREAHETLIEKAEKYLRRHGWKVINKTPNTNNPPHLAKHLVINELLAEKDKRLPKIRINKDNCPNLCISMENAETEIKKNSEYGKDKSSETSESVPQEQATHLSDTLDYNLYWQFFDLVKQPEGFGFAMTIGINR